MLNLLENRLDTLKTNHKERLQISVAPYGPRSFFIKLRYTDKKGNKFVDVPDGIITHMVFLKNEPQSQDLYFDVKIIDRKSLQEVKMSSRGHDPERRAIKSLLNVLDESEGIRKKIVAKYPGITQEELEDKAAEAVANLTDDVLARSKREGMLENVKTFLSPAKPKNVHEEGAPYLRLGLLFKGGDAETRCAEALKRFSQKYAP